jgi:hypothetical protein
MKSMNGEMLLCRSCCSKVELGLYIVSIHIFELLFWHFIYYTCLPSYLYVVMANLYEVNLLEINHSVFIEKHNHKVVSSDHECELLHVVNKNKNDSLCDNFARSRSQTKNKHVRKCDQEPSRIPIKKLLNLMYKNKKRHCKISISKISINKVVNS